MGARRLMIVLYVLEWGLPSSENTSIERVRGTLNYGAGQAVAQLGMSLLEGSCLLRMSLWNPEMGVCTMTLEWEFPSEHRQTGNRKIGDESFRQ